MILHVSLITMTFKKYLYVITFFKCFIFKIFFCLERIEERAVLQEIVPNI